MSHRLLQQTQPPALPIPPQGPLQGWVAKLNDVLRLYFTRVSSAVNALIGRNGGRFLESPNGLFYDDADQALTIINVGQPVRFNQTYLSNGMIINGATTSQITATYSGVYNFEFSGQVRSLSASSKLVWLWILRNGTDIGYSAKEYTLVGSGKELRIDWSFSIDVQAGQYIQLFWASDDIDVTLDASVATAVHPGIPSAVLAVSFVSTLPEVLPTPP